MGVTNKKIAVFGFAFKKDTGDVRETPALTVCHMLMQDGASVHVHGPKVSKEDALSEFKYHNMEVDANKLIFARSADAAVDGAHAIVVLTEWDEFKTYDYSAFYQKMMKPAFLFDGRALLNRGMLEATGFEVHTIGHGLLQERNGQGHGRLRPHVTDRSPGPARRKSSAACTRTTAARAPATSSLWRGSEPVSCRRYRDGLLRQKARERPA